MSTLLQVFDHWLASADIPEDALDMAEKEIDRFVEDMIGVIDNAIEQHPEAAMMKLMVHVSFVNALTAKRPAVTATLTREVGKYRSVAKVLAKKLGAESFGVSIGVPYGLSIGLSWSP